MMREFDRNFVPFFPQHQKYMIYLYAQSEHILKNDMFDQNVIVQERQKTVFRPTDNSFLFEHKIWMKEGYFPDKLILITGKINRVKSL